MISQRERQYQKIGHQQIIRPNCPENCMEIMVIGLGGV